MSIRRVAVALMASTLPQALASCAHGTFLQPRAEEFETPAFGYIGTLGPAMWSSLNEANSACSAGTNQSPIDLVKGENKETSGASLQISIPNWKGGAEFENLGTTIEVVAPSGSLKIEGVSYTLKQFHFHLPSEHLDDGTSMAMEAHFVWQSRDQKLAVTGVFLDVNDANCSTSGPSNIMETILGMADKIAEPGSHVALPPLKMASITNLLSTTTFRNYAGSLTTPPCSEGVDWYVAADTIAIRTKTYIKARSVIGFNSRFPQNKPGSANVLSSA